MPDGGRASRCAMHKLPGMVDVASRKCEVEGCRTRPHYGMPDDGRAKRCAAHQLPGMIPRFKLQQRAASAEPRAEACARARDAKRAAAAEVRRQEGTALLSQ
mmetsp:Transcript_23460/g.60350  ORF Transcript_23460/g.60350 Transcript_23460/m.60350 type:complete len:102 (-) Transcript_23460:254-559(-)